MNDMNNTLLIKYLGVQDYTQLWQAMRMKNKSAPWSGDELWITEHPSTYTLGSQGGEEHLLNPTSIPMIHTDRGGSITYHGPGQIVIYPLLNVRSHTPSVTALIDRLEHILHQWISSSIPSIHSIEGQRGLYIQDEKIASIGLRIANGKTYHGMSVNIDMDLSPFDNINPCGYPDLRMTQWVAHRTFPHLWHTELEKAFCQNFNYTSITREYHDARSTLSEITWPRQTG